MRIAASAETLARTYEALRAEATGEPVMSRPRGLAILRAGGLAAWMVACPPDRPTLVAERALRLLAAPSSGNPLGRELAPILAAMALASRTSSLEVMP